MKLNRIITFPKPSTDEIVSGNDLCSIENINLFDDERVGVPRGGAWSLINFLSPKRENRILFIHQNREPFDFEAYLDSLKNCNDEEA